MSSAHVSAELFGGPGVGPGRHRCDAHPGRCRQPQDVLQRQRQVNSHELMKHNYRALMFPAAAAQSGGGCVMTVRGTVTQMTRSGQHMGCT